MTTKEITDKLRELAEHWHAPHCNIDAGGACILHAEEKEAWIAGYQTLLAEHDRLRASFDAHHPLNSAEGYRCDVCGEDHPYAMADDPYAPLTQAFNPFLIEDECDLDD